MWCERCRGGWLVLVNTLVWMWCFDWHPIIHLLSTGWTSTLKLTSRNHLLHLEKKSFPSHFIMRCQLNDPGYLTTYMRSTQSSDHTCPYMATHVPTSTDLYPNVYKCQLTSSHVPTCLQLATHVPTFHICLLVPTCLVHTCTHMCRHVPTFIVHTCTHICPLVPACPPPGCLMSLSRSWLT